MTVLADPGSRSAIVSWSEPVLSGLVGPVNVTANVSSGAFFSVRNTTVSYTVSSQRFDLSLSCKFLVTVVGN